MADNGGIEYLYGTDFWQCTSLLLATAEMTAAGRQGAWPVLRVSI
jgi:hypothetical protein